MEILENNHEFRYSSQFSGTVEQWLMHPPPVAAPCSHPWLHPPGPSYATLAEVAIVLGLEGGSSTNCRCPGGIVRQSVYLSYSNICKEHNHGIYLCTLLYSTILELLYSCKFVLILTVAHAFDGVVIYCQRMSKGYKFDPLPIVASWTDSSWTLSLPALPRMLLSLCAILTMAPQWFVEPCTRPKSCRWELLSSEKIIHHNLGSTLQPQKFCVTAVFDSAMNGKSTKLHNLFA